MKLHRSAARDEATIADMHARGGREFDIVLIPVSNPELGEIRIDDNLFAIGRTEPPFDSYAPEIVSDLSRRHARIFSEYGTVYVADLGSKNGTTVNGTDIRQKTSKLQDGDEIRFGHGLTYRVKLGERRERTQPAARLLGITLEPERGEFGLQPIVIAQFPFLVSKADPAFARYKEQHPEQVNYISRRHAHIFQKGGSPWVEDLGSTNGTFVNGARLDEHAVPLHDGDTLAFGGHHFVYKVGLQKEEGRADPTVTRYSQSMPGTAAATAAAAAPQPQPQSQPQPQPVPPQAPAPEPSPAMALRNADKTTFVAAADSFLDIFCVDSEPRQPEEASGEEPKQAEEAKKEAGKGKPRSKARVLASEIAGAFVGSEGMKPRRRTVLLSAALAALLVAGGGALYLRGGAERDLKDMLARGEYAQVATATSQRLERDPDNAQLRALNTEALLKANVPGWVAMLKAGRFDQASAILAGMNGLAAHNPDAQSLIRELEWIGGLEQFVAGRVRENAPIRIYADEDKISALLKRWDEDASGHQRALSRIAAFVPEFKDPYAEALTHLRKLQVDEAVYLAAIDRLKSTIGNELNRDQPAALEPVLKEYAEKYPRLTGLDEVRADLQQYMALDRAARARKLGPIVTLLERTKFSTPPFREKLQALTAENRLPSDELVRQYQAVSAAWREGNARQAIAGMQQMTTGPWADAAGSELEHKKAVAEQFAALQKSRGTRGYDDRLLSFYASLDPDEDSYFARATQAEVGAYRDKALARAQDLMNRAQAQWNRYRENGAIEGGQRLEAGISNKFRTQARLLSEAREDAEQGMRIYTQLKADTPPQWTKMQNEINSEAELQRRSLMELRRILEPEVLKAKLALLGGPER